MRNQLLKSVPWQLLGTFALKALMTGSTTKGYLVGKDWPLTETLGV
jgi:hypothetical protein